MVGAVSVGFNPVEWIRPIVVHDADGLGKVVTIAIGIPGVINNFRLRSHLDSFKV